MGDPIGWTRALDDVEVRPLHPARNDAHGERARQQKRILADEPEFTEMAGRQLAAKRRDAPNVPRPITEIGAWRG
jgi:hypothetical protein